MDGNQFLFFFSSRRRHTRSLCDWSSDVCSSDLTHTDYAGGRTIVAPAPRGFIVMASPGRGRDIHLVDARNRESVTISEAGKPFAGWRNYVSVAISRLMRNFPGARSGATIAFASDLPRASGMSSSSALIVGVATALAALWELPSGEDWNRSIQSG